MELDRFYTACGGDLGRTMQRLPSEAMVRRFLRRFADDPAYAELKTALAATDLPCAFRAAHTLKGTAATLGLDTLAAAASALTEALRAASDLPPETLVDAVDAAYAAVIAQLARLDA